MNDQPRCDICEAGKINPHSGIEIAAAIRARKIRTACYMCTAILADEGYISDLAKLEKIK